MVSRAASASGLFDHQCEVRGLTPALPTKYGGSQNVGWAVPTNSQANVVGTAHTTI